MHVATPPNPSNYFHIPHSAANNDLLFKRDLVYKMDSFENKISFRRLGSLKRLSLLDVLYLESFSGCMTLS